MSRGEFFRIGNMSETEAMHYLSRRKVPAQLHSSIFTLVGGRNIDLFRVSDDLLNGITFQG